MLPNAIRTAVRYLLAVAVVAGVAVLTCGCKASGHIDFEIDVPAVELGTINPAAESEP